MTDNSLGVGELDGQYSLYRRAMRILVRDGVSLSKARRTVCWQKLKILHNFLPRHYREPEQLYLQLKREQQPSAPLS